MEPLALISVLKSISPGEEIGDVGTLGKVVAYSCARCGLIWAYSNYEHAKKCCECKDCDAPVSRQKNYEGRCDPCYEKLRTERKKRGYEKAEKILSVDYSGPVYDDSADKFYSTWQEYVENYHDQREADAPTLPPHAYACEIKTLQLDPDAIIENELSDHHEDAYDQLADLDAFRAFITEWSAKQTDVQTWYPDYTRVILPTEEDRCETFPHY